jgi:phosphoribosyl-ATP pyrophosphohydrolase/phosphoribosyl-AMP cyclohydrolase/histidinol dehydrogenase
LGRLERRLAAISAAPDPASNTGALLERPALLAAKLVEEATELAGADDPEAVAAEAADLLYFLMVKAAASGVPLQRIVAELDRRERRLTRRPMVAKETGR